MKFLLTGATGCLGSRMSRCLLGKGHNIIALKRSNSNTQRVKDIVSEIEWHDVDSNELSCILESCSGVDVVLHMATCYGRNGESAAEIMQTNVLFPLKILQWAASQGVSSFYNTDSFYNVENAQTKYISMYALSKSNFYTWGKYFSEQGNIEFVNMRIDHMYGEEDGKHKFIPYLIKTFKENVPHLELTAGNQKRDFIYVDDVVRAYVAVIESESRAFHYDVGSGNLITIRSLVEKLKKITKASTELEFGAIPYRKHEIMEPDVDITLLEQLGWEPIVSLSEGLRRTVDSYHE